jgi:hypothetical protein
MKRRMEKEKKGKLTVAFRGELGREKTNFIRVLLGWIWVRGVGENGNGNI